MKKMKDIRGVHATAVRNAIFRVFGMRHLPPVSKKKNPKQISDWKASKEVGQCYDKLYDDLSGTLYIENIVRTAFPTLQGAELTVDHCVYTAAMCDIVLNPDYPDIECAQAPLQRRIRKFKVTYVIFHKLSVYRD